MSKFVQERMNGLDVVHFTCKVMDNKIVKYRAHVKCAFKYEN